MGRFGIGHRITLSRGHIRQFWIIVVLIASAISALSQGIRDSRGRNFWLAVPPNDNASSTPTDDSFVSLLVATDDVVTDVTVLARQRSGKTDTIRAKVPPSTLWEIRIDDYDLYQLQGIERLGGASIDGERPNPASINVLTSNDVSLYAVLRARRSSDAWLVLPTDALSTDYIVASYPSEVSSTLGATITYPSQFVVVATQDSTKVDISLSVDRSDRQVGRDRSVILQRGESYLLQARIESNRRDDLTGSSIASSKPVVVIGGHRRAQVPILAGSASRDCLVEQMPGLETWGRQIVVPPLVKASDHFLYSVDDVSICRIIASKDSTLVTVNSQPAYLLNKGKFWDLPLDVPLVIDATKPILATILDRSANRTGGQRLGDPSMMVAPPTEQYLRSYIIGCVGPNSAGGQIYSEHFISVVIPTVAVPSLELDGTTSFTATSNTILSSPYSVVSTKVASGAHRLKADSTFGVFVYGYGGAESYGYTGGMAFERLNDPVIRLRALRTAGDPGQRDTIAIILDSIDTRNLEGLTGVRNVRYRVTFDASSFVPFEDGIIDTGATSLRLDLSANVSTLFPGDTIGLISGIHTLGLTDSSQILVDSASWFTGNGEAIRVNTRYIPGDLVTTSVCQTEVGKRLFDPRVAKPPVIRGYYDIRGQYVGPTLEGLPVGVYFRR
ncbi:MAG: hypothetical protein FGM33_00950 [Candidatus Kapabacteria bacterium]|nr:hypothetical protein [Candidatus Kapabacteria bacterium]